MSMGKEDKWSQIKRKQNLYISAYVQVCDERSHNDTNNIIHILWLSEDQKKLMMLDPVLLPHCIFTDLQLDCRQLLLSLFLFKLLKSSGWGAGLICMFAWNTCSGFLLTFWFSKLIILNWILEKQIVGIVSQGAHTPLCMWLFQLGLNQMPLWRRHTTCCCMGALSQAVGAQSGELTDTNISLVKGSLPKTKS
jgi:hypothetical protein